MKEYALTYLTGNETKYREAKALFPTIERLKLDLPEIQSLDPYEVVEYKLKMAALMATDADRRALIVDDEGLLIDGMNGLPGPFLKFFYKSLGASGLYKLSECFGCKKAWATVTLGLLLPGQKPVYFHDQIEGNLVPDQTPEHPGYGGIFVIKGHDVPYSRLSQELQKEVDEKHWPRALALKQLRNYLESELGWKI